MWHRDFPFVEQHAPLARMTTYRVGGPAQFVATPPDAAALGTLLTRAAQENVPLFLLGHGTNLLVSDAGVQGLVLRLPKTGFGALSADCRLPSADCRPPTATLRVGAGHSLPALVKWSATQGLRGLECLQGVPGTVGAALRMNAGGKHGEIRSAVRRVRGFARDGSPFDFDAGQCGFVYRGSGLSGKIVTDCELELERGNPEESQALMAQILREKCASQPVDARSAGCVFKNPGAPNPPAGKLIDDLKMKGLRFGGAAVSTLHANFLVCEGAARAGDLAMLIREIRRRVYGERGIVLEMEVEAWGFAPGELVPPGYPRAA